MPHCATQGKGFGEGLGRFDPPHQFQPFPAGFLGASRGTLPPIFYVLFTDFFTFESVSSVPSAWFCGRRLGVVAGGT